MRNVLALVLGGGRGSRLYPLTKFRSKPAVPLATKYRLIDIPLSNCLNSGIKKIYVLTQFLSVSLHRHIATAYRFDRFDNGFVAVLAAQQTDGDSTDWYEGTADAVRKNLRYLEESSADSVIILSGDQLYRMDYGDMIRTHEESGADVTIAALPVDRKEASELGVMRIDESGRVVGFLEKPQTDEEIDTVRMDPAWIDARGIESKGRDCLASMGIYLFKKDTLIDLLKKTDYQDFGREIFPTAIRSRHVQVHMFDGYWEDIGTIRSFFDANLALATDNPSFDLAAPDAPVFTRARFLPPTRLDGATISQSLLADGCTIGEGTVIENSIVGLRCKIGKNVTIRNCVLMGSDHYSAEQSGDSDPVCQGIGDGSRIENAIIDKNCRIGSNVQIVNESGTDERDVDEQVMIRDGIVVVTKGSVLQDNWQLPQ
jgi:glucose-1-phosphate adenylyltransferase